MVAGGGRNGGPYPGLDRDPLIEAAAAFGRLFRCDPVAAVLDRPIGDLPVVLAVMTAAARQNEQEAKRVR